MLECAGHQVTKELEVETHQPIVSLLVYVAHLRSLGHDVDENSVARSLRAKRSVLACLAGKERTVYGPVDVVLKVDFVEIKTVAWVTLDEDLAGQIYLGKNEIVLRAVNQGKVPAEAQLVADAVMTIQVSCNDARLEPLRARRWHQRYVCEPMERIGSPTLTPWTTAIKMANGAPIKCLEPQVL